jgi:hypothetical protein
MFADASACSACGTAHPRSARFCPRCGDPVSDRPHRTVHTVAAERGERAATWRRRSAGLGVTLLATGMVFGVLGPVDVPDPERPDQDVELPRPQEIAEPPDSDDVTGNETSTAGRALRPPPCIVAAGATCADPVLEGVDLTAAARVSFGAIVVDDALTLHRLQLIRDRSLVRWTTDLADANGGGPTATVPVPHRLERAGTTLLLGTATHLHTLGTVNGEYRWVTQLAHLGDGVTPWHGWVVGDNVVAANPAAIVVLDAEDGRIRWHRDGPFVDVLPLTSGVAVLSPGELMVIDPRDPEAGWTTDVDAIARFPRGSHPPNRGPIVVSAASATKILDPRTGEVLIDLGPAAAATRSSAGQVVAAIWEDDATTSTLVGYGMDGTERWRTDGPEQPCCRVDLRPTADGHVIALLPGPAGAETGWVIDPLTGAITQRVIRPADVASVPRAVVGSTIVWMDGTALVATDPAGSPAWRAESQSRLLSDSPVLLGTRDGLIRPPPAGSSEDLPGLQAAP